MQICWKICQIPLPNKISLKRDKLFKGYWELPIDQEYWLIKIIFQNTGSLIPNAPNDLIAGLGLNDQKLYMVPSLDIVIVRMGGASNEELLGPSSFDNELWELINAVIEN